MRTAFNLLGPLTNPAQPARQIVGVPRPELTELMARALMMLGVERAWVVHGADGLDELSTTGYTKVSECRDGAVQTFYVHPAEYGLAKGSVQESEGRRCRSTTPSASARCSPALPEPARNVVLLNAGAALFIAGRADSVRTGIADGRRGDRQRTRARRAGRAW